MKRYWADVLVGAICLLLAVGLLTEGYDYPAGGDIFPIFSGGGMALLSVILIARALVVPAPGSRERMSFRVDYATAKPWLVLLLVFAYVPAMFWLGYFASTFLFLVTASLLVGVRRYRFILFTSVVLLPLMYAFFELFLKTNLPRGLLV